MVSLILRFCIREGFSTAICEKIPLGIYNGRLSKVRIKVTLQPIFSTTPSISRSGDRIQSPTTKGRSIYIKSPPKKFDNRSLAAKPTAIPPTPPKARTPEMLNPSVCNIINMAMMTTDMRASFDMASSVVASISFPAVR